MSFGARTRRAMALAAVPFAVAAAVTVATVARADGARLVGEWRFDEPAGAVALDSSGSGLNGSLAGGDAQPARIPGADGGALRFDGGDAVELPQSPALEPASMTVAAWVRASGSPGRFRYVVSKGAHSCWASSYGLYTGPGGGANFYLFGSDGIVRSPAVPATTVWDGRWHRLVGSYDGERVRLYLDGTEVADGTPYDGAVEYALKYRTPLIGSYPGGCDLSFAGDIDTVRIWAGALSAREVATDAQPAAAAPGTGGAGGSQPGGGGAQSGGGSQGDGTSGAGGASGTDREHKAAKKHEAAKKHRRSRKRRSCTTVRANHRRLRAGRRARLVVTVRKGGKRRRHVRVLLRAHRLHRSARTGRHGRAAFRVRPRRSQHRLTVRAAVRRQRSCPPPRAYVRVAARHAKHRHHHR